MQKKIESISIVVLFPLLCGTIFAVLLRTHFYAYFIYILLGLVFYVFMKFYGKEISFLFMIPVFVIALVLTGQFFLLDFYDNNGLNPLKFHPFVLAWLVAFCIHFVEDFIKGKVRFDKIMLVSTLVIGSFSLITFMYRGFSGISLEINNYVGPISFFLFLYYNSAIDVQKVNKVVKVLIGIAVIIGIIGITEYISQVNILRDIYNDETPTWLDSTYREGYRIMTTLGHPLDNASFFLFSMILVQMNVQNVKVKYGLLLLFTVDILMTGSRSYFLLSFLVLLYNKGLLKKGFESIKQSLISLSLTAVALGIALSTPLGSTLLNRLGSADDSTQARFILFDYFLKHVFSFQMMGLGGATENIVLLDQFHNPIYLENPWLILFFDTGYFILLFLLLLLLIYSKIQNKYLVTIFIIGLSGYNSFGVRSSSSYLLFFLLTYGYVLAQNKTVKETKGLIHEGVEM